MYLHKQVLFGQTGPLKRQQQMLSNFGLQYGISKKEYLENWFGLRFTKNCQTRKKVYLNIKVIKDTNCFVI